MAGKILVDVLHLDKERLVGFTEEGEEIRLNTPEPGMFRYDSLESEGPEETQINRDAALAEVLGQYEFIKFGQIIDWNIEKLQLFNSYTRRK